METRNCQNCKQDFIIDSEDFSFYEKIKVPPPTFCPECRMVRRMLWRNCRSLYKRSCGICDKSLISMYSDTDTAPVLCHTCFNGNDYDQFINAREYDFSQNFFEQLNALLKINPKVYSYKYGNLINSDFTNYSKDNKNAYLSYSVVDCEDVMYSDTIDKSKYSMDSFAVGKIDNSYYNVDCEGNYNTHYAVRSNNNIDSYFLYDCINCSNCFMSSNLRNQQYFFKNQKFSKDEYENKLKEYKLDTYTGIQKAKNEFDDLIKNTAIHKHAYIYAAQNASGDYMHNVKNVKRSFDGSDAENIAYSMRFLDKVKDTYDVQGCGFNAELIYESMAASANSYKDYFCYITLGGSRECEYSLVLKNCVNCFGCIGLVNAQYCILNKQYSKEEYFELVDKIKRHMNDMPYVDAKGRVFKYGEFFPYDMCPFGYNEGNALDFFPISKEEALSKGYKWKHKEKRDYQITIESATLPDSINDVSESVLNEVISCPNVGDQMTQCTSAFKILPFELQFYKQKNLPLPRYCPNCRHYERMKYRNPIKLWERFCVCDKKHTNHQGKCEVKFQTTYSPKRTEKIYCEKCYQAEVY